MPRKRKPSDLVHNEERKIVRREKRSNVDAELNLLYAHHGDKMTVETAVEWAEANPGSALFNQLTHDADDALHKVHVMEMRQIMTTWKVYRADVGREVRVLTSLNIDRASGGGYRKLEQVMQNPDLRAHLIHTVLAELEAMQRRYEHIQELEPIWGAADEVQGSLDAGKSPDGDQTES